MKDVEACAVTSSLVIQCGEKDVTVCTLTRLDDEISWLFGSPWFICVLSTEGTSGLRLSYFDHPQPTERSISSRTTPNKEHKHPQDKLFRFENSRITLSSSPRLGNRRASIPTEHRRVPTDHIGKMRGLRLLSQHVQTSNILTNLAVNGDCYDEVDLPLCR